MSDYKVGHGKPPREYQIGQPLGPKPGITKETRAKQIANATKVTEIRERMLNAILAKMDNAPEDIDTILSMIDAHVNKMMADTENRGLGMPTQQVDQTSSDGSMSPSKIVINGVKPKGNNDE